MSHSLVKYKFADNQDCFPACPPGSMEVSRPQPCQLSCSRRVRSSLTSGYWCALLSRASSDNSRTTNLESPLPTKRPEAWMWSQSIAFPRVLLGRFAEQLNSTLGNAVSFYRNEFSPSRHFTSSPQSPKANFCWNLLNSLNFWNLKMKWFSLTLRTHNFS